MSITFSANAREQIFLVVSDVTVPNSNVICAGEMILPTDAEGFASYAAQSSIAPNVPHKIATAVSTLPTGIIQGKVAVDGVIGNPPSRGIYTPPLPYPTNLYLNFSPAGGTGNHYFIRARYWDYKLTESELMAVTRGPSLDISLSNTLDPRITYNRASTGTYFDMNGILQTAVNNQPRFDYDPATQVARGLLIEEQRINTMFPSVYGTGWSVAGSGTVDTNISIAPDGTNTAVRITADAVNNPHGFQQSQRVARASSTTYTTSIFAKAGTTSKISLSFRTGADWVNGTIPTASFDLAAVTASPSGGASATIVPINNGWYRLTVTATTAASAPTGNLIWVFPLNAAGQDTYTGAGENAYFWGWQVEVGQFASSYIPTSAATVTRVADVVMMPTSGWFNTTLGSAVADFIMPQNTNPSSAVSAALCISDGTTANRAVIAVSALANTARAVLTINPTTVPLTFGTISAANTVTKEAIAWDGTTLYASINGSAVVTGGPIGTPPGMNTVTIGNLSGPTPDYLNGWVQRIRYWPRVLSSTELQTVST
jgi:hypothetical protein